MDAIVQVSFNKIDDFSKAEWRPVFLYFKKTVYSVKSWKELLKIFLYELNQGTHGHVEIEKYINNSNLLGKCFFRNYSTLDFASNKLKIGPDLYFDVPKNSVTILNVIKKLRGAFVLDYGMFRIYLVQKDTEISKDELASFEADQRMNNRHLKTGSGYVAHINSLIFTPQEKLFKRIENGFEQKVLIGDILLEDGEREVLLEYMKEELGALQNGIQNFQPRNPRAFVYGMVLYAQENYKDGNFWGDIESVFDMKIDSNRRMRIHRICADTLQKYGKIYASEENRPYISICLHSFVSTPCAKQFFDYIFDYWRIDLNRDIRNLDGDDGKDVFDILINEIKKNNERGVKDLMVHTSVALIENPVGAKKRIRNYLKLIDDAYYGDGFISDSKTRLVHLLKKWQEDPQGKFQQEFRKASSSKGRKKGETLFRKPTLIIQASLGSFSLFLPRQNLKNCTEEDAESLVWVIEGPSFEKRYVKPEPLRGKAGIYADGCECSGLKLEDIFTSFRCRLLDDKENFYCDYEVAAMDVRFFNANGRCVDYASGFLPEGEIRAFYNRGKPYLLGNDASDDWGSASGFEELYLKKGDVVVLPSEEILLVGHSTGLKEGPLPHGLVNGAKVDGCRIYSSSPLVFFRCEKSKLSQVAVMLNDRGIRREDFRLRERKIADHECGYVLDLSQFNLNDGKASFSLLIGRRRIPLDFYLLKNFEYQFKDSPYAFKENGHIAFPEDISIVKKGKLWTSGKGHSILSFPFDSDGVSSDEFEIKGQELVLRYALDGREIKISFEIPVLVWRFDKSDEWNYQKPADVFYRNIPDFVYVDGPFEDSEISLWANFSGQNIESNDTLRLETGQRRFHFSEIKSGIVDRNGDPIETYIRLNETNVYSFLTVQCHSKVNAHEVFGDFDENKIYGHVDITGGSEYTISLSGPGIDLMEIPLNDGKFEVCLENQLESGTYFLNVFESEEDDLGWDEPLEIRLLKQPIKFALKDITRLDGARYKVRSIKHIGKAYYPWSLKDEFFIVELSRQNVSEWLEKDESGERELLFERKDEIEWDKSVLYTARLMKKDRGLRFVCDVLLLFPNKLDPSDKIVLRLEEDQAIDLYYNRKDEEIVASDTYGVYGKSYQLRFECIKELNDSKYYLDLEMADK